MQRRSKKSPNPNSKPPRRYGAAVRLHSFPRPRHVSGPEFAPRSRGRDSAPRRRAESRPAGCWMLYDLRRHLWIPLDSNGFHCSTRARFLAGSALRRTALQVPQRARDGAVPSHQCAAPRLVLGAVAGQGRAWERGGGGRGGGVRGCARARTRARSGWAERAARGGASAQPASAAPAASGRAGRWAHVEVCFASVRWLGERRGGHHDVACGGRGRSLDAAAVRLRGVRADRRGDR